MRRALTLIELLVVMGVVGILIAILLPALGGARQAARETVALANLRTVGETLSHYTAQYGSYPLRPRGTALDGAPMSPPPDILLVKWWPEGTIIGVSEHWAHEWLWPGIVSVMADWPENYKTWVSVGRPGKLPEGPWDDDIEPMDRIGVMYSNTFVARPELFREGAAADDSLLRGTRPDEVMFPGQKVLLWDRHLAYRVKEPERIGEHYRAPTPMAFADLHADVKDPTAATPGVANVMRGGFASPINCTPDGVRGRDY